MNSLTRSLALLYHQKEGGNVAFLGSAFSFRRKTHFLTAAHCLGNLDVSAIALAGSDLNGGHLTPVIRITRHPHADLAVMEVSVTGTHGVEPLFMTAASFSSVSEISALGFSEDSASDGTIQPVARVFRGFVQRFFPHKSYMGYEYEAAEVNFGAPAGLSGGPVVTLPRSIHVLGLMAENFESTTFLRSVQAIQEDGTLYSERLHQVIQYGVAVVFDDDIEAWLAANVGPEF